MSTKLSTVLLFLFIGVFASLEDAPRVFATTVLYESYESGGDIEVVEQDRLIGSFVAPSALQFGPGDDVFARARVKVASGVCTASQIKVSSSTATTLLDSNDYVWVSGQETGITDTYQSFVYERSGGYPYVNILTPGYTYGIYLVVGNCAVNPRVQADPSNLIYYGYLSWDGDYAGSFDSQEGITRVISSVPLAGSVVATSTSFVLSAIINVHEFDYTDDTYIRFRYVRNQDLQAVVANSELLWRIIDVPLFNSGITSTSTVVSITETGIYTYKVQIRDSSLINRILSWFGLNNLYDPTLLAEKHSTFTVVAPTALDLYVLEVDDLFNNPTTGILNNPGLFASTTEQCASLNFSITGCLTALFIPSFKQMESVATTTRELILQKAPLGYVTRAIQILTTSATSTLPLISYTFSTSSPLAGKTLGFDFNGIMASSSVILNQTLKSDRPVPKSVIDIVMPAWNVIAYVGLLFMIFHDVTGIRMGGLSRKR